MKQTLEKISFAILAATFIVAAGYCGVMIVRISWALGLRLW